MHERHLKWDVQKQTGGAVTSMELHNSIHAELGLQQAEHFPLPFFWGGVEENLNCCDEEKM